MNYKRDVLVDRRSKIIGQTQHGQSLAWSFMEHAWGIQCGKMLTPMDIWNDEEKLKHGISKLTEGGTIELSAHVEQDYLRIKISPVGSSPT